MRDIEKPLQREIEEAVAAYMKRDGATSKAVMRYVQELLTQRIDARVRKMEAELSSRIQDFVSYHLKEMTSQAVVAMVREKFEGRITINVTWADEPEKGSG